MYLKPDKSNGVVILRKELYIQRVEEMLSTGPYEELKKNPIDNMAKEIKNVVQGCKHIFNYKIDKWKYLNSNPIIPRLYALPKTHKPGNKFRPIVSCIQSPSYDVSKKLTYEFKGLKFDSLSIVNNLQLIEKLKDFELKPTHRLASLDVESLFPSIPVEFTIGLLKNVLTANDYDEDLMNEYIELTKICMKHNIFKFNGKCYSQKSGTAMGNPLSPFIANLFMSHFETELKNGNVHFPDFWARFVDDVFVIFDISKCNIEKFLKTINKKFPTIKFTLEREVDGKIPFLDLLISRNNGKLEYDIYRKKTNTSQFIHASSNHHFTHKIDRKSVV